MRPDRLRSVLFGAGAAAALGFGSAQATAAPKVAAGRALVCDDLACMDMCERAGVRVRDLPHQRQLRLRPAALRPPIGIRTKTGRFAGWERPARSRSD